MAQIKWTEEEIAILIEKYLNSTNEELLSLFEGRTLKSITSKAGKLKLKRISNITEDGYCVCKKCNKKLPYTETYFPKLKSEKRPRQICRVCNPKYGRYLEGECRFVQPWTEEEDEILKKVYPYYLDDEISEKFLKTRTKRAIQERAYLFKLKKTEEIVLRLNKIKTRKIVNYNLGKKMSEESRKKLSETLKRKYSDGTLISHWKGRIVSEEEKEKSRQRVLGRWQGEKNPRHINPLHKEKNGRWLGGITNLSQALREQLIGWKKGSMKFCNYKCLLTGKDFDEIHHLNPFNEIIKETLQELNLEVKNSLGDYENADTIIEKIQNKHTLYGICLSKEVHKIFHDNYSYNQFTKEDFEEFVRNYFKGDFDKDLKEEYRSYNSTSNMKSIIDKLNNVSII